MCQLYQLSIYFIKVKLYESSKRKFIIRVDHIVFEKHHDIDINQIEIYL
jgi:hypothetical protein